MTQLTNGMVSKMLLKLGPKLEFPGPTNFVQSILGNKDVIQRKGICVCVCVYIYIYIYIYVGKARGK